MPGLRGRGFRGSFPHFRLLGPKEIRLITFQLDRWGSGNYVVELAKVPPGPFHMPWGEEIAPQKLTAHHVIPRHRLGAGKGEDHWFEGAALHQRPAQEVSRFFTLMETEGEAWWGGA